MRNLLDLHLTAIAFRIVVFGLILLAAIYLLKVIFPVIVGSVVAVSALKRKRDFSIKHAFLMAKSRDVSAIFAFVVIAVAGASVGVPGKLSFDEFMVIAAGGDGFYSSFALCIFYMSLTAGAYAGWTFLLEKKEVMNIFDLSSNPSELMDFFNEKERPVVIDPVELEAAIKREVIGQDRVAKEVSEQLFRRARMNRPNKPLGVFMFVGPTGVGKTEMAKAIADGAFEGRLVRFDMNQFTDANATQSLIGPPPGYVGSDRGGQLTQAIFTNRSGVILFDEIEKAHSDVYTVLMTLMDEGRITEQSTGRVANASRFVIIFTSNANHEELTKLTQTITDPQDLNRAVKDSLRSVFKPEQLGRFDEIFCFNKLSRMGVAQIIGKFLVKFAKDAEVELVKVDNGLLIDTVLKQEKQSDFGIRELVRLVEKAVVDGMYECRDAGYKKVAIEMGGGVIHVRGIQENPQTESASTQQISQSRDL